MRSAHRPCYHQGQEVKIGPYTVWAGGYYLSDDCLGRVDTLIALGSKLPVALGDICPKPLVWLPLTDFGGVPDDWQEILKEKIVPLLKRGATPAVFCHAGHGRTGTLLASLVALLEDRDDPIQEVRDRYCWGAVETGPQATAVFALLGRELPEQYNIEFQPRRGETRTGKGK